LRKFIKIYKSLLFNKISYRGTRLAGLLTYSMTKCDKNETFYKACIAFCLQFRTGYMYCSRLQDGERAGLRTGTETGTTLSEQVWRKNQAHCLIA
jgi:hypothetical protein